MTPDARAARAGAAAVRARAGNAGRTEGADHPRLLHAAPASVPVRGQCRRALRRARRRRADAASRAIDARRVARGRRRSRRPARPGAGDRDDRGRRPDVSRRRARSDRPARRDHRAGSGRRRRGRGDRRAVARARRRSGRRHCDRSKRSSLPAPRSRRRNGPRSPRRLAQGGKTDAEQARPVRRARGAVAAPSGSRPISIFSALRPNARRANPSSPRRSRTRTWCERLNAGAAARLRAARTPPRRHLPRPQRGAAHRRLRGADALSAAKRSAAAWSTTTISSTRRWRCSTTSTPPGCITSSISASIIC